MPFQSFLWVSFAGNFYRDRIWARGFSFRGITAVASTSIRALMCMG